MKHAPVITKILESGFYAGNNRPHGRVTVEPYWKLHTTDDVIGSNEYSATRGPYRWWQRADNSQFEVEVPNIRQIDIDRSIDQEIAQCRISMYNQWMDRAGIAPANSRQLGNPGFFWPERGKNDLANVTWGQGESLGAYTKDGTWLADFSWKNVLVPMALLRTYQGYGGYERSGNPLSIADAVEAGNLVCTGVWIIDSVTGGTDGMLNISTRDIGRILLDQSIFPPVCPPNLYPPDYYPAGKSNYDSIWVGFETPTGSRGRVKFELAGSNAVDGGVASLDGNLDTVSVSAKHDLPNTVNDYWEFDITGTLGDPLDSSDGGVNGLTIYPYGGGYQMYISIHDGVQWLDGENIPLDTVPYVMRYSIPWKQIGQEKPLPFDLPVPADTERPDGTAIYNVGYKPVPGHNLRIRITFRHHFYTDGDGGWGYRSGLRDVVFSRVMTHQEIEVERSLSNGPGTPPFPYWCTNLMAHPTRGYWVVDELGNTFGFGDAMYFDNTTDRGAGAFYPAIHESLPYARIVGAAPHPNGRGYWLVDRNGQVFGQGATVYGPSHLMGITEAAELNEFVNRKPIPSCKDIAATHTGNGYWLIYSNGLVRGYGDAADTPGMIDNGDGTSYWQFETTDSMRFMEWVSQAENAEGQKWEWPFTELRGTTIVGHPHKLGFWAVNGCGEVRAIGDGVQHYGEFDKRVYHKGAADEWHLTLAGEYPHSVEATRSGNGYWVMGTSGRIAHFGDAVGKGPATVYPSDGLEGEAPPDNPYYKLTVEQLYAVFDALVWDFVKGPEDNSFYVMSGNGSTAAINTEWFGQPSYWNQSGLYWHEGNFPTPYGINPQTGKPYVPDYVDIVREFLMWAGFLLYDPAYSDFGGVAPDTNPMVYGFLESTGIMTDESLGTEQFDKQTILDCINMIKEIVNYIVYVDQEGGFHFESPNWWKSGNYYLDGKPANEAPNGDVDDSAAVAPGGHTSYIPLLHEATNITQFQATLSSESFISDMYIGSDQPNFMDRTKTNYTHFVPPGADLNLYPDEQVEHISSTSTPITNEVVPYGRGISHPFMFNRSELSESEEQALFAELTAMQLWFQQRITSFTAQADPTIMINDQVQIIERNTSETFTHYVRSIGSSMNLDTGVYTMSLNTNWVGPARMPGNIVTWEEPQPSDLTLLPEGETVVGWYILRSRDGHPDQWIVPTDGYPEFPLTGYIPLYPRSYYDEDGLEGDTYEIFWVSSNGQYGNSSGLSVSSRIAGDWVITRSSLDSDGGVKDPYTHLVISERVWRWRMWLDEDGIQESDEGDPTGNGDRDRLRWWFNRGAS